MNKLGWFLTGLYSGCLAGVYIIRELFIRYGEFERVKIIEYGRMLMSQQNFIFRWLLAGLIVALVLNILIFQDKKSKEDKEVEDLWKGKKEVEDEKEVEEN